MTSKVIAFLWNYLINENLPLAFRNIQQICRTILVLLNVSHYVSLVLLMLLFHGLKGCISRLYTESFSISFAYLFTLHMVYVIHLLPLSIHTFGDNNFIHAHKHTFILYFVNYLHLVKKKHFFFRSTTLCCFLLTMSTRYEIFNFFLRCCDNLIHSLCEKRNKKCYYKISYLFIMGLEMENPLFLIYTCFYNKNCCLRKKNTIRLLILTVQSQCLINVWDFIAYAKTMKL